MMSAAPPRPDPAVGLCSTCRHGHVQANQAGSRFWRCRRAASDPGFRRYPPLPVERCGGFDPEAADEPQSGAGDHIFEAS